MDDITVGPPLTVNIISVTSLPVSRDTINKEQTPGRFPEGTLAKIDALCGPKEPRAEFIRVAVAAEIKKRERNQQRRG
jgi:hypothetical protein